MTNRTIPCPECANLVPMYRSGCVMCNSSGTIPDRRAPTAAERAMSDLPNCAECGHVRYADGDLFNGLCVTCEMWAEHQITALRAEVAMLERGVMAQGALADELRAEVAALKAKLACYEGPLTDEEAYRVGVLLDPCGVAMVGYFQAIDADIRQVRRERGKP